MKTNKIETSFEVRMTLVQYDRNEKANTLKSKEIDSWTMGLDDNDLVVKDAKKNGLTGSEVLDDLAGALQETRKQVLTGNL